MKRTLITLVGLFAAAAQGQTLDFPADYREWIFLGSGFDMNYSAGLSMMSHHMLDNVFVEPSAYKAFLETGSWPEKTRLVKEGRRAESRGSINKSGYYQGDEIMELEVHMKDARLPGGWGFYVYDDDKAPATVQPHDVACYSCHEAHGAVDSTFVQFYPTILPIAKAKGTAH